MWLRCQDGSLIDGHILKVIVPGAITLTGNSGSHLEYNQLVRGIIGKTAIGRDGDARLLYHTDGNEDLEDSVLLYIAECLANNYEVCDLTDDEEIENAGKSEGGPSRPSMVLGELRKVDAIAREAGSSIVNEDDEEECDDDYPVDRRRIPRTPIKRFKTSVRGSGR